MFRFALLLLLVGALGSETIDRIAIVISGRTTITELELEEELRVIAFLNQTSVDDSVVARKAAANRLIDQFLIAHEMELSRYGSADTGEVDAALSKVEGTEDRRQFEARLARCQLSLADLRRHLARQIATLRFVSFRFRPELGVTDSDVNEEYTRLASSWKATHGDQPLPDFRSSQAALRRSLIEQRTDAALDDWLATARVQAHIVYLDSSLQQVAP